ncbi:hypothetical protein M2140_000109 [Clostridiales Family XIII bacterium PM5-7]
MKYNFEEAYAKWSSEELTTKQIIVFSVKCVLGTALVLVWLSGKLHEYGIAPM